MELMEIKTKKIKFRANKVAIKLFSTKNIGKSFLKKLRKVNLVHQSSTITRILKKTGLA